MPLLLNWQLCCSNDGVPLAVHASGWSLERLLASGLFVINPPHTLAASVRTALEQVLPLIGRGRGQRAVVETG